MIFFLRDKSHLEIGRRDAQFYTVKLLIRMNRLDEVWSETGSLRRIGPTENLASALGSCPPPKEDDIPNACCGLKN